MKIASFNINNIHRRLTNLLNWLREAEPDIACPQELKAADSEFPAEAIRQAGYHGVWHDERSWNGAAILAQWPSVVTRTDLPGDDGDRQCRYLEAAVSLAAHEAGADRINAKLLFQIANLLDVRPEYFFRGHTKENSRTAYVLD
jgi:exonuclease III